MSKTRELRVMALVAAITGLVIALMRIRTDSIDDLTREYDAIRLAHPAPTSGERIAGRVPATIQNYAWWRVEGDRRAAEQYTVKRAGAFVRNYALVVGYDRRNLVVYKAIGNT